MNCMSRIFVDYISFEREFSDVYRWLCEGTRENNREKVSEAFDELMNLMTMASMDIRDYDIAAKANYIVRILNKFISGEAALEITKRDLDDFQKLLVVTANHERKQRSNRLVRELQALIDVVPIIAKQNRSDMRHECWLFARRCGISKEFMEDKLGYRKFTSIDYLRVACDFVRNSTDDELATDIDVWLEIIVATYPCIRNTKFAEMVKKHK